MLILTLAAAGKVRAQAAKVLEIENVVQTARGGDGAWEPATVDQSLAVGDRIRTRRTRSIGLPPERQSRSPPAPYGQAFSPVLKGVAHVEGESCGLFQRARSHDGVGL